MDQKEEAQKKISETVKTLQEQRNSALDALVNTTVELKLTSEKLENSLKLSNEINSSLTEMKFQNSQLNEQLKISNEKLSELNIKHSELMAEFEKLKERDIPKVSRQPRNNRKE